MDDFFDSFSKKIFGKTSNFKNIFSDSRYNYSQEDWQELEEFLLGDGFTTSKKTYKPKKSENYYVMQDYANLGLQYTEDIEVIKKHYKKLIFQFHPDKFINDKNLYEKSNAVLRKLSNSYAKICNYLDKKKNK